MRMGLIVGLVFGIADLVFTWIAPLEDDSVGALVFYAPMFLLWMFASFRAAQRQQKLSAGIVAGAVVAFATFAVFIVLNLVRVNVFLDELTGRADWQNMMARYQASGFESLRAFVTLDYIKGTPLKLAGATIIGVAMGVIGACSAGAVKTLVRARNSGAKAEGGAYNDPPRRNSAPFSQRPERGQ